MINIKIKLVNNHRTNPLTSVEIAEIVSSVEQYSSGKLSVVISEVDTDFENIPYDVIGTATADSENSSSVTTISIDRTWIQQNIVPLADGADVVILWLEDADDKSNVNGTSYDEPTLPIVVMCRIQDATEALDEQSTGQHASTPISDHELCHALYEITGKPDLTHQYLFGSKLAFPANYQAAYANIDYDLLEVNLIKLRGNAPTGDPMILFQQTGSAEVYILAGGNTLVPFTDEATLSNFLAGQQQIIVQLAPSEFAKFVVSKPFIKE